MSSNPNYDVFPVQPSYTSAVGQRRPMLLREYDDGSYRLYRKPGTAALQYFTLHFEELSQSEMQSIMDFFASKTDPADVSGGQFILSDFRSNNAPLDGSQQLAGTGAVLAVFLDERIDFQQDGPCQWSVVSDLNIKVVSS
jgi:hypothetical protein